MGQFALAERLRLVDQSAATSLRRQRIDALRVDRSRFEACPMPRWSAEAESREPEFQAIRAETTLADRMEAWRIFFRGNQ